MIVYVKVENCRGRDRIIEIWETESSASNRIDELLWAHQNSDGYYIDSYDVQGGK